MASIDQLEISLESRTNSREPKVRENHGLLAKHIVFGDSEKSEISSFTTAFQNDI